MYKIIASGALLLASHMVFAATVNIDFLINVSTRYISSNNSWLQDSGFSGQQFILSVGFDSGSYTPGVLDYWDGQDVSSIRPEISPVSFSATPFDEELNAIQPALNYYGNEEISSPGTGFGEISYNGTFDNGTISQSYGKNKSVLYRDIQTKYIADFDRNISIGFTNYNANLTVADIVPLSLDEYLNLGYGQTFRFFQSVEEDYNNDWPGSGSWITLDGGVRYEGAGTISNISVVPVPAAVWLFGTGILGLLTFVRGRRIR